MAEQHRPVAAVFGSGSGGSTFKAFAEAVHEGIVDVDIALVASNTEDAGIFNKAAWANSVLGFDIRPVTINQNLFPKGHNGRKQTKAESEQMLKLSQRYGITHWLLMGGSRIIGEPVIEEYGWVPEHEQRHPETRGKYYAHALNTHPAILPLTADTYGIEAQKKLKDEGAVESAHTVHVVSDNPDEGPIVGETKFKIFPTDTAEQIFARVQRIEKAMLPIIIQQFLVEQAEFERAV
jgi:folate-dependent phosphoribosylglycinamide formyltransferase PurN